MSSIALSVYYQQAMDRNLICNEIPNVSIINIETGSIKVFGITEQCIEILQDAITAYDRALQSQGKEATNTAVSLIHLSLST